MATAQHEGEGNTLAKARIQQTGARISGYADPLFPKELAELMGLIERNADSLEQLLPIWAANVQGFKGRSNKTTDNGYVWRGGIVRVERQTGQVLVAFPAWAPGRRCDVSPALYYNSGVTEREAIKVVRDMIATLK